MDPNEKIQLDDITFDDVIGGDGVETLSLEEAEPLAEEKNTEEKPSDDNVLEDIIDNEEEKEEEVEEEKVEDSKEEVEEEADDSEESENESTIVGEVLDKLGYDLEKEAYADTPEGLANMTADVASKMADDRIDNVLEAFPLVKKHLDYVLAGGESQNFMEAYDPNLDYHKVTLEEDDQRSQKAILGDYLQLKGHDETFIEEMLNDFEDTGKLYQKAEAARGALAKHQDAKRDQLVAKQKEESSKKREELNNFWNGVSETIENSDAFAGISVPKRDKSKFFDYLSTPVTKEGYTQRDVDHSKADLEIKLAIDYLMYTGFDLSGLISSKAKTQNAKTLRERISKNEDRVKSTRRSTRRNSKLDLDTLDLSL